MCIATESANANAIGSERTSVIATNDEGIETSAILADFYHAAAIAIASVSVTCSAVTDLLSLVDEKVSVAAAAVAAASLIAAAITIASANGSESWRREDKNTTNNRRNRSSSSNHRRQASPLRLLLPIHLPPSHPLQLPHQPPHPLPPPLPLLQLLPHVTASLCLLLRRRSRAPSPWSRRFRWRR